MDVKSLARQFFQRDTERDTPGTDSRILSQRGWDKPDFAGHERDKLPELPEAVAGEVMGVFVTDHRGQVIDMARWVERRKRDG